MAPEALSDPDNVDHRSDLYALGAVGYYMLTGKQVFTGNIVEICGHHLHTEPTPPSERLGRELPVELEAVIMQCLAKKPEERPHSAREMRERLAACFEVKRWRQADARVWWEKYEDVLQPGTGDASSLEVTRTLAMEMENKR